MLPVVNQPPHRSAALLDQLARRMRLRAESVLERFGMRPRHFVALTVLRECDGCTQQTLTAKLEMDGTNVVGLLNDLEAENLIERRRSPEDRRRHIVQMTDEGLQRLAKAEFALTAAEEDVLGALDSDQRETLYQLLQQAVNGRPPARTAE
ncbi:MarR family winged helix-turn-helix transcriptional regulator [Actinomadura sp. B10D3]|uniref:MarR family winged helix-turn-helix transcriptional regulator n=1 Tax=Actinomadura sp. B10D3 TaxID=3153557 RepID=UPI00325EA1D2